MMLYRAFGKKLCVNTSFILALFLIYPGLMSLVQFRQFVSSAIGCLGVAFLCSNSKRGIPYYFLLTICSVLVHRSGVVFLFALVCNVFIYCNKKSRLFIVLFGVLVMIVAFVGIEKLATLLFGELRTNFYLSATYGAPSVSLLGAIRNVFLLLFMALLLGLCCRWMSLQESEAKSVEHIKKSSWIFRPSRNWLFGSDWDACFVRGERKKRFLWDWDIDLAPKVIAMINICLLVIIPFVCITSDFMRFERHGFTLSLAIFSAMTLLKRRHMILSCKAFYAGLCIVFACFYVCGTFDIVYMPLLTFESIPAFFT